MSTDRPVSQWFVAGRPGYATVVGAARLFSWATRSTLLTLVRQFVQLFPGARPRRLQKAVHQLPDEATILFCCPGNRCRSSVAERYLRGELRRRSIEDVTVESGSLVATEDAHVPAFARAAAHRYSVDLGDHEPTAVTRTQLQESDLVVVMDGRDYLRLAVFGTGAVWKTYLLGTFDDDESGVEISRPSSEARERDYWRTFERIVEATNSLADAIEERDAYRDSPAASATDSTMVDGNLTD